MSRPASTSLSLPRCGERGLQLAAGVGGEADAEAGDGGGSMPRCFEIVARRGALDSGKLLDEPGLAPTP